MKYVVRPARQDDIGEMYNISRAAHRIGDYGQLIPVSNHERFRAYYRWSKRRRARFFMSLESLITDSRSRVLVASKGSTVIGYTLVTYDSPQHLTLKGLFVRPRYQGSGVGKALFEASYADARRGVTVSLEVLARNRKAMALYAQHGFEVVERLKKHFFGAQLVKMDKHIY